MREIKFRGRKSNGEWIYGDLVTTETTDGQPSKFNIRPYNVVLESPEDVEENTIGQFTGLYDKNGKEIYEGDIIKAENVSHYVRYIEDQAMFVAYIISRNPLMDYCSIFQTWIDEYNKVVIGNIHDNPELLNE